MHDVPKSVPHGAASGAASSVDGQGEPFDTHGRTLTTAHLDHDPPNPNARLAALCPSCHMRYDAHTRRNPAQLNWFLRFVAMTSTPIK